MLTSEIQASNIALLVIQPFRLVRSGQIFPARHCLAQDDIWSSNIGIRLRRVGAT